MRTLRIIGLVLLVTTVCAPVAALTVSAQQSDLYQLIQNPADPMTAPAVVGVEWVDGKPVIRGTFDSAHTQQLRVRFLGNWYVLGQQAALSASGNDWTLDLTSVLSEPLTPGTYTVTVEATSITGLVVPAATQTSLQDDNSNTPIAPVEPTPDPKPQPNDNLAFTGQNTLVYILAACGALAIALLSLGYDFKKKRGKDG